MAYWQQLSLISVHISLCKYSDIPPQIQGTHRVVLGDIFRHGPDAPN